MKQFLLAIILFSSVCNGQDTLVYKSGERKPVKIIILGDKIVYSLPPSTKKYSIKKSELASFATSDSSTFLTNYKSKAEISNMNLSAININLGVGASTIYLLFGAWQSVTPSINVIQVSAVSSGTIDYGIADKLSVGFGVAWQSELDNPSLNDNIDYNVVERMTRTNLAVRFLGHFGDDSTLDFYYGIRTGASLWTDNTTVTPNSTPFPPSFNTQKNLIDLSVQALFGCRLYFTSIFGIHLETGIGTPYFIEGGLTFRINTQ